MRLERELASGENYSDILCYRNAVEPESGAPIYMLYEIIEVSRKSPEDTHNERARVTKLLESKFRTNVSYLEYKQRENDPKTLRLLKSRSSLPASHSDMRIAETVSPERNDEH